MKKKECRKLTKEEAAELQKLIDQLDEPVPGEELSGMDTPKKIWVVIMGILSFMIMFVFFIYIWLWLGGYI